MPLAQAARPDALGATRSGGAGAWRRSGAPVRSRAGRVPAGAASAVVTLVLGSSMPLADLVRPQRWELTWRAQPAQEALEAVPDGSVLAVDIKIGRASCRERGEIKVVDGTREKRNNKKRRTCGHRTS